MSGEKRRYIRVDETELRRLREQESRLRSVQQDLPERLSAVAQQTRQEMQQRLSYLAEREERQAEQTRQLRSYLENLEENTHQYLQQHREQFKSALQEAQLRQEQAIARQKHDLQLAMHAGFEQQREEYLRLTREQRQEYQQLFTQERQAREKGQLQLQQQIDRMGQDIQDIHKSQERKNQLAQDLLADVREIWLAIDRDYQHQRFAPGALAKLQRSLDMAKNNIAAGVSEAAIATSQKTYLDLVDLRLEIEQKEQEWLLLYNAALQDIRSLIAEVQANRQCTIEIGSDEDAEAFKLEVDYWSFGALTAYEQNLAAIESQLTSNEASLTPEILKELGAKIETLQPQLGAIVEQAKLAILSSQLRAEIGDRVVEALSALGYSLLDPQADSCYAAEDPRQAYGVKVKNIAGDEVVTVITPDRDFGVNSISINTFSPTLLDEKATQQNSQAIFELLNEEGVRQSGQLVCNPEPKPEYREFQQFRQQKTQVEQETRFLR